MGWIRRELANDLFWSLPDWQVDVESSEMREEIGLRYYLEPGDEHLAPEELGRRIDDCLVEYINTYLMSLMLGDIGIEEFKIEDAQGRARYERGRGAQGLRSGHSKGSGGPTRQRDISQPGQTVRPVR